MSSSASGLLCPWHFLNLIKQDIDYKLPKNKKRGFLLTTVFLVPSTMLSISYLVNVD